MEKTGGTGRLKDLTPRQVSSAHATHQLLDIRDSIWAVADVAYTAE